MSKNILVTGLILGKETDMCPCNNINLGWLFERPSDLLWTDKVIMTHNEWNEIMTEKKTAISCAEKLIFERLQAEGLIEFIPDTIISKPRAESILQSIETDLQCIEDLLTVTEKEKEPFLQLGKYSYCIPSLWSLYAAIEISRSVNASFSLSSYELEYLMTLIPRKFQKEIHAGRNLAMDEVLNLYLPSLELGHPYLYDSEAGRCASCARKEQCSGTYLSEIEKRLEHILKLRQYDEVRMTCEVMDKLCERSMNLGHVLTGEELWDDLREEAAKTKKIVKSRLPKINMWSKISAFATIGMGAASFFVPALAIGAAVPEVARELMSSYEEKLKKENSWVNFVNNPESVLSRGEA